MSAAAALSPYEATPQDLRAGGAHLAAALAYAERGWKVFPVQPRAKIPYGEIYPDDDAVTAARKRAGGKAWEDVRERGRGGVWRATHDPAEIRRIWTRWRGAGIGLLCGPAPECSGVWVLDADVSPEKGKDGFRTLAQYAEQGWTLPDTCGQVTPSGGRHWIFRWPEGVDPDELRNSVEKRLGNGLDTRGRGGYILLPPSLHPTGKAYVWPAAGGPAAIAPADAPAWLLALLKNGPAEGAAAADGGAAAAQAGAVRPRAYDPGALLPFLRAALDDACARVQGARPGTQNDTLCSESFAVGGLIAASRGKAWGLSRDYAESRLIAAGMLMASHGKGHRQDIRKITNTVTSGLTKGEAQSHREIPDDAIARHEGRRRTEPGHVGPRRDAAPAGRPATRTGPAQDPARLAAAGLPTGHADTDRAAAEAIWADCLPLANGHPAGLAYLGRFGLVDARPSRLRVGVLPRRHMDGSGRVHDLGWWPCLVAAYGPRGARGVLRVWLDRDGQDQARVADPDRPGRALPAHELIGETDGLAVQLGPAGEGLAVAVTLECAFSIMAEAPGAVWVVDSLTAAQRLDLPQGIAQAFLAVWRVPKAGEKRERQIVAACWHLSAHARRDLHLVRVAMPAGWSPLPGLPAELRQRAAAEHDAALQRWADDGGAHG